MSELTDLDELRKIADAATPGPWELVDHNEGMCPPRPLWGVINDEFLNPSGDDDAEWTAVEIHVGDKTDAEFIAAARTAVPELLDRLAAAEAKLAAVEALHRADSIMTGMCAECSDFGTDDYPAGRMVEFPCPTAAALGLPIGGENDGE